MRMLKIGDVGEDVRKVQKDVMDNCYDDPAYQKLFKEELDKHKLPLEKLTPDGRFGLRTQAAVIAFQRFKRLKSTNGVVGPETRTALHGGVVIIRTTAFAGGLLGRPPYFHLDPSFYVNWAEAMKGLPDSRVPTPPPPIHPDEEQRLILRPGITYNRPIFGSYKDPYWTMNMDVLLLIHTWSDLELFNHTLPALKLSGDLGYAGPGPGKTPGSVPSVMASAVLAVDKEVYHFRSGSVSANGSLKLGFGVGGSSSDATDTSPFAGESGQAGGAVTLHLWGDQDIKIGVSAGAALKEAHSLKKGGTNISTSGNWTGMVNISLQQRKKPPGRH